MVRFRVRFGFSRFGEPDSGITTSEVSMLINSIWIDQTIYTTCWESQEAWGLLYTYKPGRSVPDIKEWNLGRYTRLHRGGIQLYKPIPDEELITKDKEPWYTFDLKYKTYKPCFAPDRTWQELCTDPVFYQFFKYKGSEDPSWPYTISEYEEYRRAVQVFNQTFPETPLDKFPWYCSPVSERNRDHLGSIHQGDDKGNEEARPTIGSGDLSGYRGRFKQPIVNQQFRRQQQHLQPSKSYPIKRNPTPKHSSVSSRAADRTQVKEVLYVPQVNLRILSIAKLAKSGLSLTFYGGCLTISKGDKSIASGVMRGDQYWLDSLDHCNLNVAVAKRDPHDYAIWHDRLGHAFPDSITSLKDY
ncbi:hypothetical protein FRC03_006304 [Tulasnella sp. 419]|nr:hypothetical protein FRC03_006304 [Tulasnella sp. 419]